MNLKLKLAKKILDVFPPAMNSLREQFREAAINELSVPQFRTILCLKRGLNHVGQIAEHLGISQPATSKTIDLLVKKGLVSRVDAKDDRRLSVLNLTPKGTKLYNKVKRVVEKDLTKSFKTLSGKEIDSLVHALDLIEKIFKKV